MNFNIQHTELLIFMTGNEEMKIAAKSSLQQGLWAGGGAIALGGLLGPVGGLIGGIVGSVIGFYKADPYDGAIVSINKLEESRRKRLMEEVSGILIAAGAVANNLSLAGGLATALEEFARQPAIRDQVWKACVNSLK